MPLAQAKDSRASIDDVCAHPDMKRVPWSSWLWHLVNTEKVPGSSPGGITFLPLWHACLPPGHVSFCDGSCCFAGCLWICDLAVLWAVTANLGVAVCEDGWSRVHILAKARMCLNRTCMLKKLAQGLIHCCKTRDIGHAKP